MASNDLDFLQGGGEAGAQMRAFDWASTPLGPPEGWPQNLKVVMRIVLASRFAMRIVWGDEFIFIYNDGYRPVLGAQKHPSAMGSRTYESFREVWDKVGPLFRRVQAGEAFALEDYSLPLERNGYLEEAYFVLSYSPVVDDQGGTGGVLGVVHETTDRVLSNRRLRTLRQLAASASLARAPDLACLSAAEALAQNGADVPFALLYLTGDDGAARLAATTAGDMWNVPSPSVVRLDASDDGPWPLHRAMAERRTIVVADLFARFPDLHAGPFPERIESAVILPLVRPGVGLAYGFMVVGINPRHRLDDAYSGFLDLAAEHVLTSITNASAIQRELAYEDQRRHLAERERAKLYELFMKAPAAIAVLRGEAHVFELANPHYLELIGKRAIVGKAIADALPEIAPSVLPVLDEVRRSGKAFHGNEFPIPVLREGVLQDLVFNLIYEPVPSEASADVFDIFVIAFEVTEEIMARKKVEELARNLAVTNQELDQFAYVASHDLKAPLRGIANLLGWIEEDLEGKLEDKTRTNVDLLRGRVHRLEALIDAILSYSRAGRARDAIEHVDLSALAHEVRDLLAPPVSVTFRIGELGAIDGERVLLQQVLMNLMNNALKHGRPDGTIDVSAVSAGAFVEIVVKDDGPGIAARYHERVWGIFQTLQARDKVEGTGIGLSIVKKLVESRGGRVWIVSEEGAGAAFHFTWPRTTASGGARPTT